MLMKAMRNKIFLTNIGCYPTKMLFTYDTLSDLVSDLKHNLRSKQRGRSSCEKNLQLVKRYCASEQLKIN